MELANLDAPEPLVDAYRSAWVSALPSHDEAFGLVLAEALACGTPVVGSNDGGVPELIDGLSALWDKRRQTWHDKVAKTQVIQLP